MRITQWYPRGADRRVLITWLHHPAYGMLGIYWPDQRRSVLFRQLPSRSIVQVTGQIRPIQVYAHTGDDPRCCVDPIHVPLLIRVTDIQRLAPYERHTRPPVVLAPQVCTIHAVRRVEAGYLATTCDHTVDVWSSIPLRPGTYTWTQVHGVVAAMGSYRFLRYLVH